MDEVATTAAPTASSSQPDDDAEPAERFPFMRFCPDIRVMIWNAAMPDFAPCHFRVRCEGDSSEEILTLIAKSMTKSQRTPIGVLSSVCYESRNEVILKYPDLLPLHRGHCMRFSSSKDVVMLTKMETTLDVDLPVWDFELNKLGNLNSVIHFPFEWNTQVQNIAFGPDGILWGDPNAPLDSPMVDYLVETMKPKFDFLNLFTQIKNYFFKDTVVYASEALEAVREEWEGFIQTYVEQQFASLEHIPWPDDDDGFYSFWQEDEYDKITTHSARFLDEHKVWSKSVDNFLHHWMHHNTQDDPENRAFVTKLRGINYSTMVGFWKCDTTHSAVGPFSRKRFSEAQDLRRREF